MKKLSISQALPASSKYHIFSDDNRSLCSRYAILRMSPDLPDYKGTEIAKQGQDCIKCFDKAHQIRQEESK